MAGANTTDLALLQLVPYLEGATAAAWFDFRDRYLSYSARGGAIPLRQLVAPKVQVLLSLRLPALDWTQGTNDAFVAGINHLHMPKSALEALEKFRGINMHDSRVFSVDNVADFCMKFTEQKSMCDPVHLPGSKILAKLFVGKLKPKHLRDLVMLREPKTLEEAVSVAMQQASDLEVALAHVPPEVRAPNNGGNFLKAKSEGVKPKTSPSSGNAGGGGVPASPLKSLPKKSFDKGRADSNRLVKCYGCGELGHIKPGCPNKQLWDQRPRPPPGGQVKVVRKEAENWRRLGDEPTPHCTVEIDQGARGALTVRALLDTGSSPNVISPAIFKKLLEVGVVTRTVDKKLGTASTPTSQVQLHATEEVDLQVTVRDPALPPITAAVTCLVMDCGESMILGYSWLGQSGLLSMLAELGNFSTGEDSSMQRESEIRPATDGDLVVPSVNAEDGDDLSAPKYERVFVNDANLASEIESVVADFGEIFGPIPPAGAKVKPFEINLKTGAQLKPIPPRRLSPHLLNDLRAEIKERLEGGLIRPSNSHCSFPILMVKKHDGTWRKCVDYRLLNENTVPLKFPLQNYRSILDRLVGNSLYATLDLRQGFHQVPMHESSIPLTAFATPDGLYEYRRMPMGLMNAPAYFQQVMTDVLSDYLGVGVEVFIDDIIVYAPNAEAFVKMLRQVFQRLASFDIRLKREKCFIGLSQVEYVGHIVNEKGVTLSDSRRRALQNLHAPTTTAELRSFLGIANYFRPFVHNYAQKAKPLTALSSPKVPFRWDAEHQAAFQALKDAAVLAPLLAFIDYSQPLILRTDASTVGVGGVLFQMGKGGKEVPVAFVSKAFNETEQKWSTIEQEAFAVYHCIRQLEHYLRGHKFTIESDHRNLTYMYKSAVPKLVRWRLALMEHDFVVKHIPGKENIVADALSRVLPITSSDVAPINPDAEQEIKSIHNAVLGHKGIKATLELLQKKGKSWPRMEADVSQFIAACPTCQKVRLGQGSMAAALHTTAVDEPYTVLALDTIGPLPEDDHGNKYIICAIDCFSRFVELKATKDTSAKCAASFLLEIFGRFGLPREVRSDQGTQYAARVVNQLLELCAVAHKYSPAYRPQANGIVERANGEVMRHLKALVFDKRVEKEWSSFLPIIQRVVNASPHSALGTSPLRVMFGDAVSADRGLLSAMPSALPMSTVEDYVQQLNEMHGFIVEASQRHQAGKIAKYLAKSPEHPTKFDVGDYVLVSYPDRTPSKLHPRWRGPLCVVSVQSNLYQCQDLTTQKLLSFDVSRLKKFKSREDDTLDDMRELASIDNMEYQVEAIVDHAGSPRNKSRMTFRVRWKGYEPEEDTWESYSRVKDCEALDVYSKAHPELRL